MLFLDIHFWTPLPIDLLITGIGVTGHKADKNPGQAINDDGPFRPKCVFFMTEHQKSLYTQTFCHQQHVDDTGLNPLRLDELMPVMKAPTHIWVASSIAGQQEHYRDDRAGRRMAFILEESVVGFIPSNSAAPPGPYTFQ